MTIQFGYDLISLLRIALLETGLNDTRSIVLENDLLYNRLWVTCWIAVFLYRTSLTCPAIKAIIWLIRSLVSSLLMSPRRSVSQIFLVFVIISNLGSCALRSSFSAFCCWCDPVFPFVSFSTTRLTTTTTTPLPLVLPLLLFLLVSLPSAWLVALRFKPAMVIEEVVEREN